MNEFACFGKAVLLEVGAVLTVALGLIAFVFVLIGGECLSKKVMGTSVGRNLKTAGSVFLGCIACLALLAIFIATTMHVKDSICARGFTGAWHEIWR